MAQQGPAREPFSAESAVESAVNKLIDASKVIHHRMGLKPAEEKRVNEAFALLAAGQSPANSKGAKQREIYLHFLQRVQKVMDLSKVVLCAAGLGPSAVANMRDRVRVDLPFKIKERESEFENDVLESLASTYSATFLQIHRNTSSEALQQEIIGQPPLTESVSEPIPAFRSSNGTSNAQETRTQEPVPAISLVSLTGDVYELTVEDVRMVVVSDQIQGKIWLTDTYETNTTSFITIPISNELTNRFIIQRPRMM